MKQIKFAVSAVIFNPQNPQEVFAVLRPPEDESLPNVWGLPAVSVKAGELPETAIRRLGKEKLGTEIEPISYVGIQSIDRGDYELILMDVEARVVGNDPSVMEATTSGTKYADQKWTEDYSLFKEAAKKGSLCTRIFLESKNINWSD